VSSTDGGQFRVFRQLPRNRFCAERSEAPFLMKHERTKRAKRIRIEWVSLVVDVVIMSVAILRDSSRVCSSSSKLTFRGYLCHTKVVKLKTVVVVVVVVVVVAGGWGGRAGRS